MSQESEILSWQQSKHDDLLFSRKQASNWLLTPSQRKGKMEEGEDDRKINTHQILPQPSSEGMLTSRRSVVHLSFGCRQSKYSGWVYLGAGRIKKWVKGCRGWRLLYSWFATLRSKDQKKKKKSAKRRERVFLYNCKEKGWSARQGTTYLKKKKNCLHYLTKKKKKKKKKSLDSTCCSSSP